MKLGAIKNINPFIKSIGFVNDKSFKGDKLPETLCLGIESVEKVLYKVLNGEKILNGGVLHKGFNFIQISSETLFAKNYTYEYCLEVMNNNNGQKYKNKFFIDISCTFPENSGKIDKKTKKRIWDSNVSGKPTDCLPPKTDCSCFVDR